MEVTKYQLFHVGELPATFLELLLFFFPFILDIKLDVPAGVTQEEGHTGFLIHLLSAVRALIFLSRRIQPFLSLVDREVEFCVLTIKLFSTRWAFLFLWRKDLAACFGSPKALCIQP